MRIFFLILVFISGVLAAVENEKVFWKGQVRMRGEAKENTDYNHHKGDATSYAFSRFRLGVGTEMSGVLPWDIYFEPQYVKIWGRKEDGSSQTSTTGTSTSTSGGTHDSRIDAHQAFITLKPSDIWAIKLGRQELIYGEHLLIGNIDWNPAGRSFDALKISHKGWGGTTDAFLSKLAENNQSSPGPGDDYFYGIYHAMTMEKGVKNLDFYVLDKSITSINEDLLTVGVRAKSYIGILDYRLEYSPQWGRFIAGKRQQGEYQLDFELGLSFFAKKMRLAGEYFASSEDFDQLYPTAHRWLGYADQFARRNIDGFAIHESLQFLQKGFFDIDFQSFYRNDKKAPAYNFSGAALGTVGNSNHIADEIDFTFKYPVGGFDFLVGYSMVIPQAYLYDQNSLQNSVTQWGYIQFNTKF
ncbi:MAG: alginate export family protein [Bacteriovoracaceae bacterium]|nr:alginate export family protein [Bacteriovoracaceae bacterium]